MPGVRVLLQISAPFTPPAAFRLQPLPAVATHGIDVDITFHYVTSQFSAFGRLGVARRSLALLGDIDACKSRRSQISALLAGFAALVALAGVGSHNVQQQLAQVAEPWGGPLHPITLGLSINNYLNFTIMVINLLYALLFTYLPGNIFIG